MFAMLDAKLPPPMPATIDSSRNVGYPVDGSRTASPRPIAGTSSAAVDSVVHVRPPNIGTMNEKKSRSVPPASPGSAASQKSWLGVKWYPMRGSCTTTTLHIIHTANASDQCGRGHQQVAPRDARALPGPERAVLGFPVGDLRCHGGHGAGWTGDPGGGTGAKPSGSARAGVPSVRGQGFFT